MQNKKCLFILAAGTLLLAACSPTETPTDSSETPASDSSSSIPAADSSSEEPTPTSSEPTPTSSEPTSSEEPSSEEPSSEEPITVSTNVFQLTPGSETMSGGETDAATGSLCFWNGEGASIESKAYDTTTGKLTLTYTASSWAWYGVQMFYRAPYSAAGSSYAVKMKVTSTVSGSITINGTAVALEADTEKEYEGAVTQAGATTISMQLGVDGTPLASGTITISDIEVLDSVNTYHTVTYKNGEETLATIKAKASEKAWYVPTLETPSGKVFSGWYSGDTLFNTDSDVITEDTTLTAKFIDEADATQYTVTYKIDDETVGTAKVIEGRAASAPSYGYTEYGFGYGLLNDTWYSDEALTTAYDFTSAVSQDTTLYGKKTLKPSATYNWGYELPAANFTYDDKSLTYAESELTAGESWQKQINFIPVPAGETGTNYALSFEYKTNLTGPVAQIFDSTANVSIASASSLTVSEDWQTVTLEYAGGSFSADNTKLTFELGAVTGDLSFSIRNLAIATVEEEEDPNPSTSETKAWPIINTTDNTTKIQGAGIWIWFNAKEMGYTSAISGSDNLTLEITDPSNANQTISFVTWSDFNTDFSVARLYVTLATGVPDTDTTERMVHVTLTGAPDGNTYDSTLLFTGTAYTGLAE